MSHSLLTLEAWCDYAIIFQVYYKYVIMIQGGSGVVSCDWTSLPCENLEFFLNLCFVLKQYIISVTIIHLLF